MMEYAAEAIASLSFVFIFLFCRWVWKNSGSPVVNWPVFGMLPGFLYNVSTIHDYITKLLSKTGLNFDVKIPLFVRNMEVLLTSDPKNLHYMLSTNCANFIRGPAFRDIFDALGDGLIAAELDSESWRIQRKLIHSIFTRPTFLTHLEQNAVNKLENGVFKILNHVADAGLEVDLQDVLARFTFDLNCITLLGYDPCSLSLDFPEIPFNKALNEMEEVVLLRHLMPLTAWKVMRWLNVGPEKKGNRARRGLDKFLFQHLSLKRQEVARKKAQAQDQAQQLIIAKEDESGAGGDVLSTLISEKDSAVFTDVFVRDAMMNLLSAGKDTTSTGLSWFIWNLTKNPRVLEKIQQELRAKLMSTEEAGDNINMGLPRVFKLEEVISLVYLHAAICETLRLYPPAPFNHKSPAGPDVLPSGHRVGNHTEILISIYAMGRMEAVWGKDCLEFKPERWINDKGGIVHVPTSKFNAFSAGPRTCVGKDLAMSMMKMAAAAIVWNYRVEVVKGHQIVPDSSIVLHMKHGLKVRMTKK